jgi:hypothetical protein
VRQNPGVAHRDINIDNLSEGERQAIKREWRLQFIPYTRVYDKNGKFVGDSTGAELSEIKALVKKGF